MPFSYLIQGFYHRWAMLAALCALSVLPPLQAAEVDQFTLPPGEPNVLPDGATQLSAEVNTLLKQALQIANQPVTHPAHHKLAPRRIQPRCEVPRLYDALAGQLARPLIGQLETFAESSPLLSRRRVPLEASIYRDFHWQASPTLVWSERVAAVVNLAGVDIGTDKLGHFFTEGYSYFRVTEELTEGIEGGLLFGEWSESLYFGAQTTGVFSFADLAANFHGLRFWNRILAHQPDPLTGKIPQPYVVCKQERWVLARSFRWEDYVDTAWHEGINCPALRDADLLARIQEYGVQCHSERLPLAKYGTLQPRLLNTSGLILLPDHLQPEVILEQRAFLSDIKLSRDTLDYIRELRTRFDNWRHASVGTTAEE